MPKTIRATITVEVPYSNELMNNGTMLDKELRKVIDKTPFLNCKIQAGGNISNKLPVIKDEFVDEYPDRARPDGFEFNKIQDNLRGMYIPEYKTDET